MTARLATRDDLALAHIEDVGAIRVGEIPHGSCDKPQIGGLQFDCGYLSPHFITDPESMEVKLEIYILIHEKEISRRQDLLPLLDHVSKSGKPLLIPQRTLAGKRWPRSTSTS